MRNLKLFLGVVALVLCLSGVAFGQIMATLSLPEESHSVGDSVTVNLNVAMTPTTWGINAFDLTITYDTTVVRLARKEEWGTFEPKLTIQPYPPTLLDNYSSFPQEGMIKFIAASKFQGGKPIHPSMGFDYIGTIDFIIIGTPGKDTPLTITAGDVTIQPRDVSENPRDATADEKTLTSGSITIAAPPTDWAVSPKPINFGDVMKDTQQDTTVTVENTGGTNPLYLQKVEITGTGFDTTGVGALPKTIAAGNTAQFKVRFSPDATGDFTGKLIVTTANGTPAAVDSIVLSGKGVQQDIDVTSPLAFGDVVKDSPDQQNLEIRNVGDAPLRVDSVRVTNSDGGVFVRGAFTEPTIIQGSGSVNVPITFTPTDFVGYTGQVTVYSDDPDEGTVNVALTGTGILGPTTWTMAPKPIAFGELLVGQNDTTEVTVTNTGTTDLRIDAVAVTGDAELSGDLRGQTLPALIVASGTFKFDVIFAPGARGDFTGKLKVTTQNGSPSAVDSTNLTGKGVQQDVNVDSPLAFGGVLIPTPGTKTDNLVIQNVGDYPLVVDSVRVTNSDGGVYVRGAFTEPTTIQGSGSANVPITFTPTELIGYTGQVTVYSDDPDEGTVNVALTGSGSIDVDGTEITADPTRIAASTDSTSKITVTPKNTGGQRIPTNVLPATMELTAKFGTFAESAGKTYSAPLGADSTYTATLKAEANVAKVDTVTATLYGNKFTVTVEFVPAIAVGIPDSLEFGGVRIETGTKTLAVIIKNNGLLTLTLSAPSAPAAPFSRTIKKTTFAPGEQDTAFTVTFDKPAEEIEYRSQVNFTTNDPNYPNVAMPVIGRGTLYKKIDVTPKQAKVLVDTAAAGYDADIPADYTTVAFTAMGTIDVPPPEPPPEDATTSCQWTSSSDLIAVVGPAAGLAHGVADGLKPGQVTITAASGDPQDTATLNVYQLGDMNLDNAVNVQDVIGAIDHIIYKARLTDAFKLVTVDRNADTKVNVLDPVKMLVLDILHGPLGGVAKLISGPIAFIVPHEVLPSNGVVSIPMGLQTEGSLSAMQFEVRYDSESLTPAGVRLTDRCEGMEVAYHAEGGVLYGVVYSLTGGEISPGASSVLDVSFERTGDVSEDTEVSFAQAILVDAFGDAVPVQAWDGSVSVRSVVPGEYGLSQNYPNPFNPETTVAYALAESGEVVLEVFGVNGQLVARLADGYREAGRYEVSWDGRDMLGKEVSSGIYVYRLRSGEFSKIRKMLLLK